MGDKIEAGNDLVRADRIPEPVTVDFSRDDNAAEAGERDGASAGDLIVTGRQQREIDYHKGFAQRNADLLHQPIDYTMLTGRRWWNQYWEFFHLLREQGLAGKRVLVVGCGFGEDAIRAAKLGAEVYAFDLSPDVLAIARQRARRGGVCVEFAQSAAECLPYPNEFFDVVVMRDIMHHVDIEATVKELKRVSRRPASWVLNEIYSHSWTDTVRRSSAVEHVLYPVLARFIYRGEPYITEDERKLSQHDLRTITAPLSVTKLKWFYAVVNRLLPDGMKIISKADRVAMIMLKPFGGLLAGRVLLVGQVRD